VGAIFLFATLVVHALLPSLRHAVRGLSLMAHCACMLGAHLGFTIGQLTGQNLSELPCQVLGKHAIFIHKISKLCLLYCILVSTYRRDCGQKGNSH
jgi:membrane protein YqaA with SNARE-associated domain